MPQEDRTIIIGGGIIGICAAWHLARRGHPVTILEKSEIGAGASSGNAGIIAFGHPPLPRPGLAKQVLKWMAKGDSPLYVPPRIDLDMIRWFWNFHRACTQQWFELCMHTLSELGRLSSHWFDTIIDEEGIDVQFDRRGWLEVYQTQQGFDTGRHEADIIRSEHFEAVELSRDELLQREPIYRDNVLGAMHFPESVFTDPMKLLDAFAQAAQRRGAELRTGAHVQRILHDSDRFTGVELADGDKVEGNTLVLAAGIWSTQLAGQLGIDIPMQAGKGYHRNIQMPDPPLNVASVLAESHTACTPMGEVLRLAGTVEFSGINDKLVQRRLDMMSEAASHYMHNIEDQPVRGDWCGLRPCTADGLPAIGWAPRIANVFIATGHARMGLSLAPGTGKIVADMLLDNTAPIDIETMRADRFTRGAKAKPPAVSPQPAHA